MKNKFATKTLTTLGKIARLDEATRLRLLEGLCALPTEIYPFDSVAAVVEECMPESGTDSESSQIGSAIATFLFTVGSASQSPDEVLETTVERLKALLPEADAAIITANFLRRLLDSPTLLVSFKATALFEDSEHLLIGSKVLVDIRPVFSQREPLEIVANALLYKLRMTYRSPVGSELESIIFTLRAAELKELGEVIARAAEKASILRDVRALAPVLESKYE